MSDTIAYKMCRPCREAIKLAQTITFIHPSVLAAMREADDDESGVLQVKPDPIRRN